MTLFDDLTPPDPNQPRRVARSQGVHGCGSRTFTDEQCAAVVECLARADRPMSVEALSQATGVPGRTVRAIVSDADGLHFLLGGDMQGGYTLAESTADADRFSSRLGSQIKHMALRLSRRRKFARGRFGGQA